MHSMLDRTSRGLRSATGGIFIFRVILCPFRCTCMQVYVYCMYTRVCILHVYAGWFEVFALHRDDLVSLAGPAIKYMSPCHAILDDFCLSLSQTFRNLLKTPNTDDMNNNNKLLYRAGVLPEWKRWWGPSCGELIQLTQLWADPMFGSQKLVGSGPVQPMRWLRLVLRSEMQCAQVVQFNSIQCRVDHDFVCRNYEII